MSARLQRVAAYLLSHSAGPTASGSRTPFCNNSGMNSASSWIRIKINWAAGAAGVLSATGGCSIASQLLLRASAAALTNGRRNGTWLWLHQNAVRAYCPLPLECHFLPPPPSRRHVPCVHLGLSPSPTSRSAYRISQHTAKGWLYSLSMSYLTLSSLFILCSLLPSVPEAYSGALPGTPHFAHPAGACTLCSGGFAILTSEASSSAFSGALWAAVMAQRWRSPSCLLHENLNGPPSIAVDG